MQNNKYKKYWYNIHMFEVLIISVSISWKNSNDTVKLHTDSFYLFKNIRHNYVTEGETVNLKCEWFQCQCVGIMCCRLIEIEQIGSLFIMMKERDALNFPKKLIPFSSHVLLNQLSFWIDHCVKFGQNPEVFN